MDENRKSLEMNRIAKLLLIMIMVSGTLVAQNTRPGFEKYLEKYKAEKVSFITEKLDLTVDEAQKFWPAYNEYENKRDELIKSKRLDGHGRGHQEMSSAEMEKMVDNKVEQELQLAQLKMEFHKKVKKLIPIEKVVQLYRAENEFMNYMLNRIRENGDGRRGRGNNPDR